jgi:hypothetical protein
MARLPALAGACARCPGCCAYEERAMKFIGNMMVYVGLFQLYLGSFGSRNFTFSGFLLSVVFGAPFLLAGGWIIGKAEGKDQEGKDDAAQTIIASGEAGKPFFLYLRPFDSTNAYRIVDAHRNAFSMETYQRDGFDDIERLVARALESTAPFIALGVSGEHRGAGRATVDESAWQAKIGALMQQAKIIIIMPSSNEGTLYELKLLVSERLLEKTLFIMPPVESYWYKSIFATGEHKWQATRAACAAFGLTLPEQVREGALFSVDAASGTIQRVPLPGPEPREWTEAFQRLIDA